MHRNSLVIILLFGLLGIIRAQDEEINAFKNKLSELNVTNIPTIEDAEKVFKKKCIKESNEAAYDTAMAGKNKFETCIKDLVDFETLKNEIEEAKPTGDLDLVFKKYCRKSPILKECVSNFTTSIEPCLSEKERGNKAMFLNITESLTNFICYKEGDRIALFIAEGGPECLMDKQEAIEVCVNNSMSKYAPKEQLSLENLPDLLIQAEQCEDLTKMQNCIVSELEKCDEPTPGNIAESLFKFIKQVTPCGKKGGLPLARQAPKGNANPPESATSAASVLMSSLFLVITAVYFI